MMRGRAGMDMGEPLRKPSARLHFDIGDKLAEHVVEQRDLVAVIAARAGGKEIGDAFENAQALCVPPAETASLSSSISDLLGAGPGLSARLSSGGTILKAAA